MASSPSNSLSPSPARPAIPGVTGARAKCKSAPGVRKELAPGEVSSPTDEQAPPPSLNLTAKEYRDRLVAIYDKHAPAKNLRVDYLLQKYQGQEEYLYRTVCTKYNMDPANLDMKSLKLPPAANSGDAEMIDASKSKGTMGIQPNVNAGVRAAPPPIARAKAATPKAATAKAATATPASKPLPAHVPPPVRPGKGSGGKQSSTAGAPAAVQGKVPPSNGKALAAGVAAASERLLAEIDLLLLGDNTGFFDDPMGDMSSCSDDGKSGSMSASGDSSSEGEDEDMVKPSLSKLPPSVGATGVATGRDNAGSNAATRGKAAGSAPELRRPPSTAEAGKPQRDLKGKLPPSASGGAGHPKPPPLRKTAPASAAAAPGGDGHGGTRTAEDGEDSDIDDAHFAAALAARLETNDGGGKTELPGKPAKPTDAKPKPSPPPPLSSRGEARTGDDSKQDGAPAARPKKDGVPPPLPAVKSDVLADSPAAAKAKAGWGAPPPLRTKGASNGTSAAKPKASSAPLIPKKEAPPPPLFDQWLAVLKFLSGWNDQKKGVQPETIKAAFCEHLVEEGIESATATQRLCATIVPLLSDMRRTDKAVMKNVKKDLLMSLKIIQIYILRIVTFELLRERDAAAAPMVAEPKKKKKDTPKDGAPYLASDISSLAKSVQHFRFEGAFSAGLQKLIVAIRAQKPSPPKKVAESDSNAAPKQSPKQSPESEVSADTAGAKRKAVEAVEDSPPPAAASTREKGSSADDAPAGAQKSTAPAVAQKSTAETIDTSPAPLKRQRKMV